MSGPKHTPGPWRFYQEPMQAGTEWHVITNEHRTRVIANVPVEPGNAMDEANAHLIAAAPRLAAALKGLVADIEALMEDTEGVETTDGDGMPYTMNWERMLPGGKYEYLTHWNDARAALREAGASIPPTVES